MKNRLLEVGMSVLLLVLFRGLSHPQDRLRAAFVFCGCFVVFFLLQVQKNFDSVQHLPFVNKLCTRVFLLLFSC